MKTISATPRRRSLDALNQHTIYPEALYVPTSTLNFAADRSVTCNLIAGRTAPPDNRLCCSVQLAPAALLSPSLFCASALKFTSLMTTIGSPLAGGVILVPFFNSRL
jgi:hypothetical protein